MVLNCLFADVSCFQGLFFCPEAATLLLHNFCIYHISPPGHEVSKVLRVGFVFKILCFAVAVLFSALNIVFS